MNILTRGELENLFKFNDNMQRNYELMCGTSVIHFKRRNGRMPNEEQYQTIKEVEYMRCVVILYTQSNRCLSFDEIMFWARIISMQIRANKMLPAPPKQSLISKLKDKINNLFKSEKLGGNNNV